MVYVKVRKLEIFLKINVDQTVGIHDKNLDCKMLSYGRLKTEP
jgi:hypothetical protein